MATRGEGDPNGTLSVVYENWVLVKWKIFKKSTVVCSRKYKEVLYSVLEERSTTGHNL